MESKTSKLSNFKLRLLSSIILLPVIIWVTIGGGFFYLIMILVVAYLACNEWAYICGKWSLSIDGMGLITFVCLSLTAFYMNSVWLGFLFIFIGIYIAYFLAKYRAKHEQRLHLEPSYLNRPLFYAIGMGYLGLGFGGFAYMRNVDPSNISMLWIFGVVVCSDVSAYVFGSLIGGKKLAPRISPNKTWSGFILAIIVTFVVSYIASSLLNIKNVLDLSIFGAVMVVVAHVGDLLQSAAKRYLQIKDSGNIIPGHGGILDRIDALLLVSIVSFFIVLMMGENILQL